MTNKEAIHKLEYSKKAYQMLIDEKVDSGKFVGKDVEGEWKADTPLDEAYKSMIEALDLAIKALEQQSSDDCISREEAIRVAEQGQIQGYEWQFKKLCTLPSVTPQQTEWILCSERLPEKEEIVLITIDSSYYPRPDVDMGFYKVETKKWYWFNKEDINPSIKVIGWMPLPQPYKIESEE